MSILGHVMTINYVNSIYRKLENVHVKNIE